LNSTIDNKYTNSYLHPSRKTPPWLSSLPQAVTLGRQSFFLSIICIFIV